MFIFEGFQDTDEVQNCMCAVAPSLLCWLGSCAASKLSITDPWWVPQWQ